MFRNDIEGLRGFAVLIVIFYHCDLKYLCGGYIGVDIFFVISGYLITGIIFKNIQNNNFYFAHFFNNRCKRILPSSIVIVIVIIFLFNKVNDIAYKIRVYQDCIWAILFNANTNYYIQSLDYYKSFQKQTPILHYWSLSLEEQFYLFYPLIILTFYSYRINVIIILLFFISTFICLNYTYINKSFSYFLIFSRAWQLLSGGITKIYEDKIPFKNFSYMLLLLLLILSNIYTKYIDYPGVYSLFPVLFTMLIVKKNNNNNNIILETMPIRKCGEISFSLYLAHFPILILFQDYKLSIKFILILVVSYLLYISIERPFHYNDKLYNYISPLRFGTIAITFVVFILLKLNRKSKIKLKRLSMNKKFNQDMVTKSFYSFNKHTCYICCAKELKDTLFNRYIFFLGDSHSRVLIFSISNYAKMYGWKILHRWIPFTNIMNNNIKLYETILENRKYDLIITTYKYPVIETDRIRFNKNFINNLRFISCKSEYVIVVDDNPSFTVNPINTLIHNLRAYEYMNKNCIISPPFSLTENINNNIVHINFSKYYYQENKCLIVYNNTLMYFDNNHLSIEFVRIIGKELLEKIISLPNFINPIKVTNISYKCMYWTPQKDPHYQNCKKCD